MPIDEFGVCVSLHVYLFLCGSAPEQRRLPLAAELNGQATESISLVVSIYISVHMFQVLGPPLPPPMVMVSPPPVGVGWLEVVYAGCMVSRPPPVVWCGLGWEGGVHLLYWEYMIAGASKYSQWYISAI